MASTRVRGITIELGADTSGLSKALKNVNTEIGSTQKQLKDVEKLLKLDPTNTELLAQKQRLLQDSISNTSTKLKALKEAQEQVGRELAETGEGQAQYDALAREIVVCENELKSAKKASDEFNSSLSKMSSISGKLSSKFNTLASKTKGISMAAGGALLGLGSMAVKAAQSADDLNTLSKQTGIATEELQKMQYASELIDVPVDTITNSLRKLKKNITSTSSETTAAWKQLNVELKNTDGEYRDITDIFYDTVKALGSISNETERDILAMQIFGKSADELAGILDDGGASLRALGEEADNLGVIIPQEDLDKANEFNDAIDRLKAQASGTFAQIGNEIAEMILPLLPKIQEGIENVLKTIRQIDPEVLKIGTAALGVVALLSPLFSVLSKITGLISTLSGSASGLSAALGGISASSAVVVAGIAGLIAAFVTLWQTNDDFRNHIIESWQRIVTAFNSFGEGIIERLNSMGFEFSSFSEALSAGWTTLCNFLVPIFTTVVDTITNQFENFLKILTGLFDVFAGIFTGNWEQVWSGLQEIFEGIMDNIKDYFGARINDIIGFVNSLIDKLDGLSVAGHSINIPKIPMIGLAQGGVLSSGSALVGEAGPELLTVSGGQAMVQPLTGNNGGDVVALLENYLPYLAERTSLYMDSGALVGSIAPDMDSALGGIAIRNGRR